MRRIETWLVQLTNRKWSTAYQILTFPMVLSDLRIISPLANLLQCYFSYNNNNNNRFTALCPGLPGWAGTRRNTHLPTILIIIQSLSASSIYHDPQHPPCSNYVLDNLFAQPLSMSSLVYLLDWSPPPHIPYISSPNQCLLFTAHAHTVATCFAVVSILYHLFLVFLSTPYLELCVLS